VTYQIIFTEEAADQIRDLPKSIQSKVIQRIEQLAENPIPHSAKKIEGFEGFYRIRFSEWRVLYQLIDSNLIIEVLRVGHRREVYKRIKKPA
jgi:mRNA interferase RelE/StbE